MRKSPASDPVRWKVVDAGDSIGPIVEALGLDPIHDLDAVYYNPDNELVAIRSGGKTINSAEERDRHFGSKYLVLPGDRFARPSVARARTQSRSVDIGNTQYGG